MKGVTKVFLGIILILMSLSLCCCGAEPTEKSPGEVNEILDVSKILISASLQSELKNDSFSDKDIVICAYDYYNVFGQYPDGEYREKYKVLEIEKVLHLIEVKSNKELTEAQQESLIGQIEAEFDADILRLENQYRNEIYTELEKWLETRALSYERSWNSDKSCVVSLKVYSVDKDDLIALQNSGLHMFYSIYEMGILEDL